MRMLVCIENHIPHCAGLGSSQLHVGLGMHTCARHQQASVLQWWAGFGGKVALRLSAWPSVARALPCASAGFNPGQCYACLLVCWTGREVRPVGCPVLRRSMKDIGRLLIQMIEYFSLWTMQC